MRWFFVFLSLMSPVYAQQPLITGAISTPSFGCPPERPHRRDVQSAHQICTLMSCLPKLMCSQTRSACWYVQTNDCNSCSSSTTPICLSDDELREAEGRAAGVLHAK